MPAAVGRRRFPACILTDLPRNLETCCPQQSISNLDHYHALISAFGDLTGVPILLNTSFNENEPVVCRPREALDCFLRTDMDVLVLGDTIIERQRDA